PRLSKPSALITGAGGFIGSHLTERLLSLGWRLTTVTREIRNSKAQAVLPRTQLIRSDLVEVLSAPATLNWDYDFVFHLAGSASVPASMKAPLDATEPHLATAPTLLPTMRTQRH